MSNQPSQVRTRRQFLRTCAASAAAATLVPSFSFAGSRPAAAAAVTNGALPAEGEITFGVITDIHHGLAGDADSRLHAFMDVVQERDDLAFLIQMGDFCHPTDEARAFVEAYNEFPGRCLHVLGNHDMDKGSKSQTMKHWGMESRYGSFDAGDFHFVWLDLNNLRDVRNGQASYTPYENANFYVDAEQRGWCDPEQLEWLAQDLAATDKQTLVFSHQPLGIAAVGEELPQRQQEVFDILLQANADAAAKNPHGGQKVIACLSGHLHVDRYERVQEIHCLSINSASYHWAGGMQPYADPLFCFVTLNPAGRMYLHGRHSEFVDQHPWEQGLSLSVAGVTASISDRAVVYQRQD